MKRIKKFFGNRSRIKGFDKKSSEQQLEAVIAELRGFEKAVLFDIIHKYDDYLELEPNDSDTSEEKISDITRTFGDEPEYKIGIACAQQQNPVPKIMNITARRQRNSNISIKQMYFCKEFVSNGRSMTEIEHEMNGKDLLTRLQIGAVYLDELSNLYTRLDNQCRQIRKRRLEAAERVRAEMKKTFYFSQIYKLNKNIKNILKKVEERIERPDETIYNPS